MQAQRLSIYADNNVLPTLGPTRWTKSTVSVTNDVGKAIRGITIIHSRTLFDSIRGTITNETIVVDCGNAIRDGSLAGQTVDARVPIREGPCALIDSTNGIITKKKAGTEVDVKLDRTVGDRSDAFIELLREAAESRAHSIDYMFYESKQS